LATANSFAFALLASVCIYAFSCRRGAGKNSIILFGIALNFLFSALTTVLQYISDDEDLKSLVFWNMGSLLKSTWPKFLIVATALTSCLVILSRNAWKLTAMTLDDTKARSLGVNTHSIRPMVILLTSLLTSFAVCFVGIIAPHVARQLVGEEQRFFLPLSGLIGAVVVLLAFAVSKLVIPGVILPIGIVTAVIAIPVFLAIIFGRMRRL
jgi:iron complex transport system permease protein